MFRVVGAICFILAGAVLGANESGKLKKKCVICGEIRELFTQLHIKIRYSAPDVYELIGELRGLALFSNLDFIGRLPSEFSPDINFHENWQKAVSSDASLGEDEKRLLISFGAVLGTSDIDGQLMAIEEAIETLSGIEDRRIEEYSRKGKLYRSLGMLSGVMVGILLI